MRKKGTNLTPGERAAAQDIIVQSLSTDGSVRRACALAGIARQTYYDWEHHDPAFLERVKAAIDDANDRIREEIYRRAIEGVEEPVVSQGRLAKDENGKNLMVRKYSDQLLKFLAQARMPEFKDRLDVTTNDQSLNKAYEAIAAIADNPDTAEHAERLIATLASYGLNTGGAGVSR